MRLLGTSTFGVTPPNYILVTSGTAFVVPAVVCYLHHRYLTSILCCMLAQSSVQYHGNPTPLSFLIDQAAVATVVWNTVWMGYELGLWGIVTSVLLKSYALFIYCGPCSKRLAYHPNLVIGSLWHASIHVVIAAGIAIASTQFPNADSPQYIK